MSALRHHRSFAGTLEGAGDAAVWLHRIAAAEQLSGRLVFALELCLEELFTNVVRHGKHGRTANNEPAPLSIDVAIDLGKAGVDLVVSDNATGFDMSHAEARPVHQSIDEIEPGGLGIQLIRSFSEQIVYEPLPWGNRVIVKFLRHEVAAPKAEA